MKVILATNGDVDVDNKIVGYWERLRTGSQARINGVSAVIFRKTQRDLRDAIASELAARAK